MTTDTNNASMEIGGGNTYNIPKWYIKGKDNKKFGKYTTKQMIDYFNQGKLNENSTVACTGMKTWAKLKDTELMQHLDIFDETDFVEEDFISTDNIKEEKTINNPYKQVTPTQRKKNPASIVGFIIGIICLISAISSFSKAADKYKKFSDATKDNGGVIGQIEAVSKIETEEDLNNYINDLENIQTDNAESQEYLNEYIDDLKDITSTETLQEDKSSEKPVQEKSADNIQYEVVDETFYPYQDDNENKFWMVLGIKNTGNTTLYLKQCKVDFYDASGAMVSTEELSDVRQIFKPGEICYCYTHPYENKITAGVDINNISYKYYLDIQKSNSEPDDFVVSDVSLSYDEVFGDKYPKVTYHAINNSDSSPSGAHAIFYDSSGKVIGIDYSNSPCGLKEHTESSYDMTYLFAHPRFDVNSIANVEVVVESFHYQW